MRTRRWEVRQVPLGGEHADRAPIVSEQLSALGGRVLQVSGGQSTTSVLILLPAPTGGHASRRLRRLEGEDVEVLTGGWVRRPDPCGAREPWAVQLEPAIRTLGSLVLAKGASAVKRRGLSPPRSNGRRTSRRRQVGTRIPAVSQGEGQGHVFTAETQRTQRTNPLSVFRYPWAVADYGSRTTDHGSPTFPANSASLRWIAIQPRGPDLLRVAEGAVGYSHTGCQGGREDTEDHSWAQAPIHADSYAAVMRRR